MNTQNGYYRGGKVSWNLFFFGTEFKDDYSGAENESDVCIRYI